MTDSNHHVDDISEVKPQIRYGQKHNVINVAEIIANEKVYGIMDRMEMCTCEKCACDVLALALNSVEPKYVTTDAGKQYIQLEAY